MRYKYGKPRKQNSSMTANSGLNSVVSCAAVFWEFHFTSSIVSTPAEAPTPGCSGAEAPTEKKLVGAGGPR